MYNNARISPKIKGQFARRCAGMVSHINRFKEVDGRIDSRRVRLTFSDVCHADELEELTALRHERAWLRGIIFNIGNDC
jgi:hypothetical protein